MKPTEDQAEIIQRAGLEAETVTVTSKSAVLPLAIIFHGDGGPVAYWVLRDEGKLRLTDSNPCPAKIRQREDTQRPETADITPGPDQKAEILLAGVDPGEGHLPTRDELAAALTGSRFSENERVVVLAVICDRLETQTAIARETGLKRQTVATILSRAKVRQALKRLRRGEPLIPSPMFETILSVSRGELAGQVPNLSDAMRHAREDLANCLSPDKADAGYMADAWKQLKLSHTASATDYLVASIALQPRILQHPTLGPALLAALVKLLELARYGSKSSAASARKSLAVLTRGLHGSRCGFPPILLEASLGRICVRLGELRSAWAASFGRPIPARREAIRCKMGAEQRHFIDAELDSLLKDALPLLTAAARVAEKATTSIGRDVWERAGRQSTLLAQYRTRNPVH
jgi:hypothetical protein